MLNKLKRACPSCHHSLSPAIFFKLPATQSPDPLGPVLCPYCLQQISLPLREYLLPAITIPGAVSSLALYAINKFIPIWTFSPLGKLAFYGLTATIFIFVALATFYYAFPLKKITNTNTDSPPSD